MSPCSTKSPQTTLAITTGLALFLTGFPSLVQTQEIPFAIPEEVGLSSSKLREIEPVVGNFIDQNKLAGAVTLVLKNGKIAHLEAHGWQDIESRTPMNTDSIFRIYSMTKAIVSTGVMMLVEAGQVDLDDAVADYIPEFKNLNVWTPDGSEAANRPPTVRDLLRHTAGLSYGFFGNTPVDQKYRAAGVLAPSNDSAAFAKKLGQLPLLYQPGSQWVYSVSVDVQGVLIERVSQKSLDAFLRERIFEPLDMRDTGFHVPPEKRSRFATNYSPTPQGALEPNDRTETSSYRFPPRFFSGGGGLVSTARDYARFVQMLLNQGELFGHRIVSPKTIADMTRNQLPDAAYPIGIGDVRDGVGFGLGFSIRVEDSDWDPDGQIGEYGWGGAASTHFWISPKDDLAVITLEQTMPYNWNLEYGLKGLIYDALQ